MSNEVLREVFTLEVGRDIETNLPRWQNTWQNEKLHCAADGRPAQVIFDDLGRPEEMGWFSENRYHRVNGPALVKLNPENGICIYEEYRLFGKAHRSFSEPAIIQRDKDSGEIISEQYFVDDQEVSPKFSPQLDR